eukprot:7050336-Prorocentrum_lima.AAC.1
MEPRAILSVVRIRWQQLFPTTIWSRKYGWMNCQSQSWDIQGTLKVRQQETPMHVFCFGYAL